MTDTMLENHPQDFLTSKKCLKLEFHQIRFGNGLCLPGAEQQVAGGARTKGCRLGRPRVGLGGACEIAAPTRGLL